jgi:hypothetical protein
MKLVQVKKKSFESINCFEYISYPHLDNILIAVTLIHSLKVLDLELCIAKIIISLVSHA